MTADDLRRIALALPGAGEKSHFGKADFRVKDKIFASLPEPGRAVLKFAREQQEMLCSAEPAIFSPVKGGWGLKGWTNLALVASDEITLASALRMGWENVSSKSLQSQTNAFQE